MKEIRYSKKFINAYKKLVKLYTSRELQEEISTTTDLFLRNPNNSTLRNHELKGSLRRKRSISVNLDIRIIFVEKGDHFLFLDIGTHDKVYK